MANVVVENVMRCNGKCSVVGIAVCKQSTLGSSV
jgi:hypothetical protein